tara:strand:+ start:584 stop:1537 length:954 start_codon:yes stop_codon:yes gene_type:complete
MPRLTPAQLAELAAIIKQHTDLFLVSLLGKSVVTEKDIRDLIAAGLIPPETDPKLFEYSYVLGKVKAMLTSDKYRSLTFDALKEVAGTAWHKMEPPSILEQFRIDAAKSSAGTAVQGISDDIKNGLFRNLEQSITNNLTEQIVVDKIRDVVVNALESRRTVSQLAYDIPRELKSYNRDWLRVASTEMHAVRTQGTVDAIQLKQGLYEGFPEDSDEQRVVVRPTKGACPECRRDYLGANGKPKIWNLNDLLANGTNVGVPKKLRKPVLPPHHPWCLCEVDYVPPGFDYDAQGNLVLMRPEDLYKELVEELGIGSETGG